MSMLTMQRGDLASPRTATWMWPGWLQAVLFVLPAVALLIAFVGYPLVSALFYSLFRWPGFGERQFVGLGNFINLAGDPAFGNALVFTFMFTALTTVLQTVVPLLLAAFFMQKWKGGAIFRTLVFVPSVISLTITGLLWQLALQPEGGLVNTVLADVGLGLLKRPWLADSHLVLPTLVVVSLWQSLGFYLLIYYASLLRIDPALYESARVDGAGGWALLWHITVPSLRRITTLVVSLNVIAGLKVFDLIYAMTAGGPGTASQSLGIYLYKLAFGSENGGLPAFGYADAIGVVMMFAAAILFVLVNVIRRDHHG